MSKFTKEQDLTANSVALGTTVTMSSREIADICKKKHQHVRRDIEKMLSNLELDASIYGHIYLDAYGREQSEYVLPKLLTATLITGYRDDLRYKVIERLDELEKKKGASTVAVPDFSDPAEAARAWADQYEARKIAESTKAEIGSRREATAMNTASLATKKAKKLSQELDKAKEYATIKRMSMLYHGQEFAWRELKHVSKEMDLPPIDVFDSNYGTVKAYHTDVWMETYALDTPE